MSIVYCLNTISNKTPPKEFLLFKFGDNPTYKYDTGETNISFTHTDAYRFLANNADKKVMIDYDHGMLNYNSADPAETAKAAGSGMLKLKEDGLYLTDVEWTPLADEKLKNGEFQYISPAYAPSPDGEIDLYKFINVALTNLPALMNNAEILNTRGKNMSDEKDKETQELKAELAAMKLSMKNMTAEVERAKKTQDEAAVATLVSSAIEQGKLGNADRAEYVAFGADYGVAHLEKLLNKLSKSLPTAVKYSAVQAPVVTGGVSEAIGVESFSNIDSDRLNTIIKALSAKDSNGAEPLIKSEEDKIKFLNRLRDPKKTIEASNFFSGWGNRFGKRGA